MESPLQLPGDHGPEDVCRGCQGKRREPVVNLARPTKWSTLVYSFTLTLLLLMKHGTCQGLSTGLQQTISTPEEEEPGKVIGRIGDGMSGITPPFSYLFVEDARDVLNVTDNGEITVSARMDRESKSQYGLFAQDSQGKAIQVTIVVTDINDHSPQFPVTEQNIQLLESVPKDAKYPLGSVVDEDLGINSVQEYEIVSGNTDGAFQLRSRRAQNGLLYLDLELIESLDYEVTESYVLEIRAYDGGSPRKHGTMFVNIEIGDANDNQPIFDESLYSVQIMENATVATSVLQVQATDRDSGENGHISYQIDRQRSDQQYVFGIDQDNGLVYVNKELDYESQKTYELIIVARDNGTQQLQTTAIVSVEVGNVNDNPPVISMIFVTEDGTSNVPETAEPGSYVARLSVSDPDQEDDDDGGDLAITVRLDGGDGFFGLEERDNGVYLVLLEAALDREMKPEYTMTVTAQDSGSPSLQTQKSFTIHIADTNDNSPQFEQHIYYADIQEVVPPGSSVIQMSAVDEDTGNNSLLTYEILHTPETHSDWFEIDRRTGLVTTSTRVDCETASEPQLTVVVTDSGFYPLSASATVIVRIRDVNDNQPIFDQSFYNATVPEDTSPGSCVLTVTASDPDCGPNAGVSYTMANNLGFQLPIELEVREDTGQICVTQQLDYETRQVFDFPVLATDPDGLFTTSMVKITVADVNDNRPFFYPNQYSISLEESSPSNTEVVAVRATDSDAGHLGTVTYSIVSGNQRGYFEIGSTSGMIKLRQRLPSTPRLYILKVLATDGGGLTSAVQATISVSLLDPSQHPPEFSLSLYRMSVPEDADIHTSVGTVEATANSAGEDVTYSIISGDPDGFFGIDSQSGVISTSKDLDHEDVPWVLLNIQAESGDPPTQGQAQVNVTIADVNDNYPQFSVSAIVIPVREDVAPKDTVYIIQATDPDSGDNGKIQYAIDDPSDTFMVNRYTGQITLKKALDHEDQTQHEFRIRAYDLAPVETQSTLSVTIEVQDVNDNAPVFSQPVYTVSVPELEEPQTQFDSVLATDVDSGNNGRIIYLLKNGAHMDKFGVFPDSGALYTKVELDHEMQSQYDLEVIAVDNGIPPKSSTAQVVVNIIDANDNTPTFQQREYSFYIEENRSPHSLVGFVLASDKDVNNYLKYYLTASNSNFDVDADSGEILSKTQLDREAKSVYTFTVGVTDQGSPPKSAMVQVTVHVTDVNDNSPAFKVKGHYVAHIEENQEAGAVVLQASAEDADLGENGTVIYSFGTGSNNFDSQMFEINSATGTITTKESLDRETKSQYVFKIVARDQGNPSKRSSKNVEVYIIDENESPPLPEDAQISIKVKENTPIGKAIGQVRATDTDSGENGRVAYYIVRGNIFGTFGLNSTTGTIFVSQPVDYEESSSYTLQVRATDSSAINPMSSIISVNITIEDVNDHAPQFDQNMIVIPLRENIPKGTAIYTLNAQDEDSGSRGSISYSIESQSPNGVWFSVRSSTGMIYTERSIDHEEITQVSLVIKATDQAPSLDERLFTTVTLLVLIEDVNDNIPQFEIRPAVDILEDEPIGYPIMHVVAVDADSHDNGRVTYGIASGNELGHFDLEADSGKLTVVDMLDREVTDLFQLNISARDHGQPVHTVYKSLAVHIVDVNDNAPVFNSSVYTAFVSENTKVGQFVTRIYAVDRDTGANANLSYIIPYGIADNMFAVDAITGDIITNDVLDREVQDSWVITAYVRDGAFPALYDTTTVIVNIIDVNDNSPVFTDLVYDLKVPENAHVSVIHTVLATDDDAGKNGRVTYSIIGGNTDGKFSINASSGKLSCQPLDREATTFYNLTVEARDGGSTPLRNITTILITVLDDNDNDPQFREPLYAEEIDEDIQVGKSILTVEAFDSDEGLNAEISYSLNNATQGLFKIDSATGVVTTAGEFDREKVDHYTFEVYATDGGLYGPRSVSVRVDITIVDVNDNSPVFEQIPYSAEITQNHGEGQYVVQVTADDKDDADNGDILYSFESNNKYFRIDPVSGEVMTKILLDPDAVMLHRLNVIARDNGSPARSSTGLVQIKVGNTPASGNLRFLNRTYNVYVAENSVRNTPIVQVEARFVEETTGSISYYFASGNEDNTFNIGPQSGRIKVENPSHLDFEMNGRLRLIVVASANSVYDYTTVWVNLRDVNDNTPKFMQDRYTSSVWEGNSRGTYVTQILARDADQGDNGYVTYRIISGNTNDAFVIDPPNTGIVKTNFILDREIEDSYRLEIEATDSGKHPLSSVCVLKIQIIDINDNAPFFPRSPAMLIKEGTGPGTFVLQVTANDRDLSPVLNYDFSPDGNPDNAFSIDRYSGRIAVAKTLDYEYTSQYRLVVQASDEEHIQTTEVVINLEDENDNPPIFSQQSYQVSLPENTEPHYSVVTVDAFDRDDGDNARVTYSMLSVEGFYIDSETGTIYTNKTVLYNSNQPDIHLVVTAEDHGTPRLAAVVPVRVQVMDINNHAPVFTDDGQYRKKINEDAKHGTTVIHVFANDADDLHENKKIGYHILSGNEEEVFEISTSTGEIVLTGSLDRERTAEYTLSVEAKDHGEPPLSSLATVRITVKDVNDNSPNFTQQEYHAEVEEDLQVGEAVIHVSASDLDAGANGKVEYKIASGNDGNHFEIERDEGIVSIRTALDYEQTQQHKLIIQATDASSESQRSAFSVVKVDVKDVNEFSPSFPQTFYFQTVMENEKVGTYIFTAKAVDADGGDYGKVHYELIDSGGFFTIDINSGDISTAVEFTFDPDPNRQTNNRHTFKVRAADTGGRENTVNVIVNIEPKFIPSFPKDQYDFAVPGNAKKGDVVGQVKAGTSEELSLGKVVYRLEEANEYFAVNATSGIIYLIKDLQAKDEELDSRRRRRFISRMDPSRFRRALASDSVRLVVQAVSSGATEHMDSVVVEIAVDRTCQGCAVLVSSSGGDDGGIGTPIVLAVVLTIIAVILAIVIIIMYFRRRDRKRQPSESRYDNSFTLDAPPPVRTIPPPAYNEVRHVYHPQNVTGSEMSDQSHSASSGHGSVEDEDEEIRIINATPMHNGGMRVPDSGIQQDDDALSDHSIQNHQDYLARLGIESVKVNPHSTKASQMSTSVESMHQFSHEGGEAEGADLGNLVYTKVEELEAAEKLAIMDGSRDYGYGEAEPSNAGSLSSVINSEEEFSGSYNWDYLLDWGPQYQPLAHVFAEIARLKDDSIKPKTKPTQIVPQRPVHTQLNPQLRVGGPPPIITDAPPRSVPLGKPPLPTSHGNLSASSNTVNSVNSARTSQLTNVSLPKSPISYESSFTSPAMSPSFTPSLSPLATRSPSISPLVTPKGPGSSVASSGHNTPSRSRRTTANGHIYGAGTSSGSEQEFRI